MKYPTPVQQRVLRFVEQEITAGRLVPTLREIAAHFNFRSSRAVACHLEALKKKGFIIWDAGKARSLRLTSGLSAFRNPVMNIPLFGSIPAGFSEDCVQEIEGCISVDTRSIGCGLALNAIAIRVSGDSMIGKHICDGDLVILEHGSHPRPGQIVAALIDGKSTLKTFLMRNGRPFLKAENPKYPDLVPCQELMVQGVFRALIRKAGR